MFELQHKKNGLYQYITKRKKNISNQSYSNNTLSDLTTSFNRNIPLTKFDNIPEKFNITEINESSMKPIQLMANEGGKLKKYSRMNHGAGLQVDNQAKRNGQLPDELKNRIESFSGISMDNVNVHYNSSEPSRFKALAYTKGSDIYLSPGQEAHLPHEACYPAKTGPRPANL